MRVADIELSDLLECLEPARAEAGWFEFGNLDLGGWKRVFGGQILAQAIVAAQRSAPDRMMHNLHVEFARPGDTGSPLIIGVDALDDGRRFARRRLEVRQDYRILARASAVLRSRSTGEELVHDHPEIVGGDFRPAALGMVPWQVEIEDGVDLDDRKVAPPSLRFRMRCAGLPDDPVVHAALLAHASDLTLIGTALRPHAGLSEADAHDLLETAVTSHSMWFHRDADLGDWLTVEQCSPTMSYGFGFGLGSIRRADGRHVAGFSQQSVVAHARLAEVMST